MLQEAGFNACREGPALQHTNKAISAAVQNGLDDEEVRAIRDRVPKVNSLNYLVSVEYVSPLISSDDEEGRE